MDKYLKITMLYKSHLANIIYLEFGVWKGHSIKYFAAKYKSKDSEFYGFDLPKRSF